jgi:hypothetical protein
MADGHKTIGKLALAAATRTDFSAPAFGLRSK